MSELGPHISVAAVDACRQNAGEIGEALSRTLDRSITASAGESIPWDPKLAAGAGLVVVLEVGAAAAVVIVPASTGLLPAWYTEPDATGKSKLATLAQELGMLVLPDSLTPGDSSAFGVDDLAAALARGQLASEPGCIPLSLSVDGQPREIHLVWPATAPKAMRPAEVSQLKAPSLPPDRLVPEDRRPKTAPVEQDPFDKLPVYSRSLLHIQVPVMVTLAAKKQPVSKIVELVPGSILQFNKSCDEMLDLEVSGLPIAKGECVKVGDKFGLRVSSLVLPAERFNSVQ